MTTIRNATDWGVSPAKLIRIAKQQPQPEPLDLELELPEQEWCDLCSLTDDPEAESGMPRDIISQTVETATLSADEWDPAWGPAQGYLVTTLSCGHVFSQPC